MKTYHAQQITEVSNNTTSIGKITNSATINANTIEEALDKAIQKFAEG